MFPDPHRLPRQRAVCRGESAALLPNVRSRRGGSNRTAPRAQPGREKAPAEGEAGRGGQVSGGSVMLKNFFGSVCVKEIQRTLVGNFRLSLVLMDPKEPGVL